VGCLSTLYIRIQLEGELAQIFEFIKEAHELKPNNELLQTLIADDIRCFGNTVEIPISKEGYQQIWRLIKEFGLDYSSVEEFVEETFIDMLKLSWELFNQGNPETLQKKTLAYIV
jgi:hypothetical protein